MSAGIISGEVQPSIPPLEMPKTRPVRPIRKVIVPEIVKGAVLGAAGDLVKDVPAPQAPAMPKGTLNQNTQCQEIATSAPPSTGPMTRPTAATMVLVPMARPSCSLGKASVTIAAALANRNAPPMPCRIRHRISWVPSAAKPAPSEATANTTKPIT